MRFLLLTLALSLAACDATGPPELVDEGLDVRTDRAEYAVGDEATVSVINETDGAVRLKAPLILGCTLDLERKDGETWTYALPFIVTCVGSDTVLARGETFSESFSLDVEPGVYRYSALVYAEGYVASAPFEVR